MFLKSGDNSSEWDNFNLTILLQGTLSAGTFTGENITISGLRRDLDGPITLGFRAEDATVADSRAQLSAPVYTLELLGDATMVTVRAGGGLVSVKAHKEFRAEIGDDVSISIPVAICHLFDSESGERIEGI